MKTREVTKERLLILGILILVTAYFMGLCVNGICTSDWTIWNIAIALSLQVSSIVYMYDYLRDRAKELLENGYNVNRAINMYVRTRKCAVFGIFCSLALWAIPTNSDIQNFNGTVLTTLDLFTISLIVTIYTTSVIKYLNKEKMRRKNRG